MAACPNINSKEWKDLVDKTGSEFQAYALYFKNNYEIPTDTTITPVTADEAIQVNDLSKFTKVRNEIIFSLNKKVAEYKYSKNKTAVNALRDLVVNLEKADINTSVNIMINNGLSLVNSLTEKVKDISDNPAQLKQTSDYLGVFNDLHEIASFVNDSPLVEDSEITGKLNTLLGKIDTFNKEYVKYGTENSVKLLAKESTYIRDQQRMLLDLEYVKQNPRSQFIGKPEEYQAKKEEYIKNKLVLKEDEIQILTEDYVRDQLNRSQQDVGTIAAWIDDPRGTNDHIIQLVVQLLDKADFTAINQYSAARGDLLKAHKEFERLTGKKNNQKEKYEGIIEKVDGKETNYMVANIYNSALNDFKTFKFRQLDSEVSEEVKATELKEFRDKYIKPEFHNKSFFDREVQDPFSTYVKDKFKNPQWKKLQENEVKKNMWSAISNFNKASDRISMKGKLGNRLPAIKRHEFEALTDDGIVSYAKQSIKDTTKKNVNDIELGATETLDGVTKVLTDNKGNVVKKVNLPFRGELNLADQSFDLVGMALANRYASLNYREKNNIKADIEIVKDIMADRKIVGRKSDKKLITSVKNAGQEILGITQEETQEIETDGYNSNSFKLLSSIIEDRMYGVSSIDGGEVLGVDVNKVSNTLMKWSGNTFLIGNYLGATSNVLQGKVMNFLEGVKGTHYDRKNLRNAEKVYIKDLGGILNDIGAVAPSSKTNLMMERFLGTSVGFDTLTADIVKNSKAKRLINLETLHGLNTSAEHYIQGTLMYAILDKVGVTDKYEVVDEKLSLKEGVEIDESLLSRKIKGVVADLQGNYDPNNKAMAQRYWYGKLAFFLRKWIVRGTKRRWMGINTTGKSIEEILKTDPHLIHYSQETGEFKEGTYVSVIRFLRNSMDAIKSLKMQALSQNWNELTDMERQNIRSAVTEMALMVGAFAAATLLQGLADEEDEQFLYSSAYVSRRLYGELMFFLPLNPSESLRILRTPSATISTLESLSRTMSQLTEDVFVNHGLEEYTTGSHKGKYKSIHMLRRTFDPFYKNVIDRDAEESLEFLKNF